MKLETKKIIIYTVIVVVILFVAGFVVYQRFLPPELGGRGGGAPRVTGGGEAGRGPGEEGDGEEGVEPQPSGEGSARTQRKKLQQITDFSVISFSFNKKGDRVLFHQKNGGDLFSSNFSGSEKDKISNITIVGLVDAVWKKGGETAAVFYLDGETIKGFLHSGTSTTTALPQRIKSFSWSPDSTSLAYLISRDTVLDLFISDTALKNPKRVFSTPILDTSIAWAQSDKIVFQTAPSGLAEGYLFSYLRSSGGFTRLIGPRFGLSSLWSPDGSRVLIMTTDGSGRNPSLAVHDASGKSLTEVSLKTLPEKCVWKSSTAAYCAAPKIVTQNILWPDDYLRGELNTKDVIFFLDFQKNESTEIPLSGEFDVSHPLLSPDNAYLFFINRFDGTLWGLEL